VEGTEVDVVVAIPDFVVGFSGFVAVVPMTTDVVTGKVADGFVPTT
jgi:ABC-type phosphate transport system permease subunit